jgi:nucleotide-binding universal stress UspA family protein
MGIFPTRILLATDGSKEAARATEAALGLAQKTGSGLPVVHVLFWASESARDPEVFDPAVREEFRGRAREGLEELVGEIEASGERWKALASGWGVRTPRSWPRPKR